MRPAIPYACAGVSYGVLCSDAQSWFASLEGCGCSGRQHPVDGGQMPGLLLSAPLQVMRGVSLRGQCMPCMCGR